MGYLSGLINTSIWVARHLHASCSLLLLSSPFFPSLLFFIPALPISLLLLLGDLSIFFPIFLFFLIIFPFLPFRLLPLLTFSLSPGCAYDVHLTDPNELPSRGHADDGILYSIFCILYNVFCFNSPRPFVFCISYLILYVPSNYTETLHCLYLHFC